MMIITFIWLGLVTLMLIWTASAISDVCKAIGSILDIERSREKIEDLLCKHILELQADKGRLTDENIDLQKRLDSLQGFLDKDVEYDEYKKQKSELAEAREIIKELFPFAKREAVSSANPNAKEIKRAEQFLGEEK